MTIPARALLSFALVLFAITASAQPRDLRSTVPGTAAIAGVVVSDEETPRPVRRVRVTCSGPDFGATAITDDRGRFAFAGLRAGRYTIAATKDAWVPAAYGARRPMRAGSAIPVSDGQTANIVLRLLHGSVITGVVLDHDNQPAANTIVSAMRFVMQNGERRLSTSGTRGLSDDRGAYRIYGLPPGDYVIGATPRGAVPNVAASELRLIADKGSGERTVALAPTFYPGTAYSAQAVTIALGRAEERAGVDFALQLVPTARVEGTITQPDGAPAPPGTQVNLIAGPQLEFPGLALSALRSTRVASDGAFSFADVSPGTYTIVSRAALPAASGATHIVWASTELAIDGDSIAGLALGLQPGMTLAGQLRFDGSRLKPPADLTSVRVTLQPVQPEGTVGFAPPSASVDAAGRFVIRGVTPGPYRLAASFPGSGHAGGWMLRSATVNGLDSLDSPLIVSPAQSLEGAVVTFTDRLSALTGVVHNATGGAPNEFTVILFSADQAHWGPRARRIQAVKPASDGAFAFRDLPSGSYYLAAIDDVETGEWFDPAFLQRLLPTAMKLSLENGEQKTQDIRLGG